MSYFLIFVLFGQNDKVFMRLLKGDKSHLPTGTYGSGNTKSSCLIEQLIVWDPRAFPTDFLGQFLVFLSYAKIWNMESQGPLQASVAFSSCEQTAPERHKWTKESHHGFPQGFIFFVGVHHHPQWSLLVLLETGQTQLTECFPLFQLLDRYWQHIGAKMLDFMVVNISNV